MASTDRERPSAGGSRRGGVGRWAGRLGLLALSTVATAALCELGLRTAGVAYPNFYQPDAYRGWALRPGAAGWWTREGRAYVEINRDGLRDREHRRAKPPGTWRLAVLGDSFAEAMQVERDAAFWVVAERRLTSCPAFAGRTVEALNFGVSGYGTAQELLTLRHVARRYAPDVVLVALFTGNDLRDNLRVLDGNHQRPYLVRRRGGLELDDSFLRSPGYSFRISVPGRWVYGALDHLRLAQLAKEAKVRLEAQLAGGVGGGEGELDELAFEAPLYRPPETAAWRQAWAVTEAILRRLRDESEAYGARLAVVVLSNPIQVHPDRELRRRACRAAGVADLFYPERRLRAFAAREGIPLLALAPRLAAEVEETGVVLHGFPGEQPGEGHWNVDGHRLAGEAVAAWLCSAGALRQARE